MPDRPYVLLSVAVSIDGRINDDTPNGLPLSNADDFDRVDQVRADSDAILIGAGTLRNDNPRMTVKSEQRRAERVAAGKPEHPVKILVTATGDIDPTFRWFHTPGRRLVYTTDRAEPKLKELVGDLAEVIPTGPELDYRRMLEHLHAQSVDTVMVEGGEQVHTSLLAAGLVDEIHLVIAPLLVGSGPRFVGHARFPWPTEARMDVVEIRPIGDVVLIRYRMTP